MGSKWLSGVRREEYVSQTVDGVSLQTQMIRRSKTDPKRTLKDANRPQALRRWWTPNHDHGSISPYQLIAIARIRIGFNATSARIAATMLSPAATMNTAFQFPVAAVSTFASGTSSEAVPFAV